MGFCFSCHLSFFRCSNHCILHHLCLHKNRLNSSEAIAKYCILWHFLLFWSPSREETKIHSLSVFLLVRRITSIRSQRGPTEVWVRAHFKYLYQKGGKRKPNIFGKSHHYSLNKGVRNIPKCTWLTSLCSQFRASPSSKGNFGGFYWEQNMTLYVLTRTNHLWAMPSWASHSRIDQKFLQA